MILYCLFNMCKIYYSCYVVYMYVYIGNVYEDSKYEIVNSQFRFLQFVNSRKNRSSGAVHWWHSSSFLTRFHDPFLMTNPRTNLHLHQLSKLAYIEWKRWVGLQGTNNITTRRKMSISRCTSQLLEFTHITVEVFSGSPTLPSTKPWPFKLSFLHISSIPMSL